MVPTDSVVSRKSRTSTPPPRAAAGKASARKNSGGSQSAKPSQVIKAPEVQATRPTLRTRLSTLKNGLVSKFSRRLLMFVTIIVILAALTTFLTLKKPSSVAAWSNQVTERLSQVQTHLSEVSNRTVHAVQPRLDQAAAILSKVPGMGSLSKIFSKVLSGVSFAWNHATRILSDLHWKNVAKKQRLDSEYAVVISVGAIGFGLKWLVSKRRAN